MQKLKSFVREYGVYFLIAVIFFGVGFLKARYNLIIVSESKWDEYVKADQTVKAMLYEEELEKNLIKMYE